MPEAAEAEHSRKTAEIARQEAERLEQEAAATKVQALARQRSANKSVPARATAAVGQRRIEFDWRL